MYRKHHGDQGTVDQFFAVNACKILFKLVIIGQNFAIQRKNVPLVVIFRDKDRVVTRLNIKTVDSYFLFQESSLPISDNRTCVGLIVNLYRTMSIVLSVASGLQPSVAYP